MSDIKKVSVKKITFGDGSPKICVPLVAEDKEKFEKALETLAGAVQSYDLVEWRADIEIGKGGQPDPKERIDAIRAAVGEKPVLFTIRTAKEGGEADIPFETYAQMCTSAAAYADLVDVELFSADEERVKELVNKIHENGSLVVMSSHDFNMTPTEEQMCIRMVKMQTLDADITKLAVMPKCEDDVLRLLEATVHMKRELADRPFITMSMGTMGQISRMSGALTGSALTFASAGRTSAPGQMDAAQLREILRVLG